MYKKESAGAQTRNLGKEDLAVSFTFHAITVAERKLRSGA